MNIEYELAVGYRLMAEAYIDSLIDIENINESSENYDIIMEANERNTNGIVEAIVKAINVLIDGIKKVIAGIANFFKTSFMTKEEKETFKAMQQFIKENPQYGKKTVYIPNYAEYEKEFKAAYDKIDAEIAKDDPDETLGEMINAAVEERVKNIKHKCAKNTVKFVGSTLDTADKLLDTGEEFVVDIANDTMKYYKKTTFNAALEAANHNDLTARQLKRMMDAEIIDLEKMKKECGFWYTEMFKTKVNRYAKRDLLRRTRLGLRTAKLRLFQKEDETLRDVMGQYKRAMGSYYNGYRGALSYQVRRASKEMEKNKKFFTGGKTK